MKPTLSKISAFTLTLLVSLSALAQDFQGQAYYSSKSTMDLGSWGARMSEAQKKQVQARLKNRLEKTYVLTFNKEESVYKEQDKLDAMSGATDSWGQNFTQGKMHKNVKENVLTQSQEFYGKQFLVEDKILAIDWKMGSETKQIGKYTAFKATASIPTTELMWYNFSWGELRAASQAEENGEEPEVKMTEVEAWYTPQVPVGHGPGEFWGLPGLILEVNADNTTLLCSKIVMNPKEKLKIEAPDKGKEITKVDYKATINKKMQEMMNNRGRRRTR